MDIKPQFCLCFATAFCELFSGWICEVNPTTGSRSRCKKFRSNESKNNIIILEE